MVSGTISVVCGICIDILVLWMMKLLYVVLTNRRRRFLQTIINLINDPLRGARALSVPHYISRFFRTFDGPNISRIHSRVLAVTIHIHVHIHTHELGIALPSHAELPGLYRFLLQLSRVCFVFNSCRGAHR